MRKTICALIILLVLLLGGRANQASSQSPEILSYTFEYLPGPKPAVQVVLAVGGESDGSSRLSIATDWGGVKDCRRFVHDLTVRDSDGKRLDVLKDDSEPQVWTVLHEPGSDLIVTYELRAAETNPLSDQRTKYEPVITDSLFHLIGETGIVYPEWLENRGELDIELEWTGFADRGWTVVSSHDNHGRHIHTDLSGFRHAIFLAGPFATVDRDIPGGVLRVAVSGVQWGFAAEELADQVAEIVSIEREFFDDYSEPFFLVTVVPAGPPVNAHSISMGGTGLTNSFALFLAPGTSMQPNSMHRRHVLHLLAHEYFHTWNGGAGTIALEEPEELSYWFSEGFTDFYASRLLRRSGLFSEQEWVDRLNNTIVALWGSPVATKPAAIIEQQYWTDRYVRDLPYDRGELVAVMLDERIRQEWDNTRSLDHFMRDVLADARMGEKASTDNLLNRVSQWTGNEFADQMRRIVVDGALPRLPGSLTEPSATLTEATIYDFDPGFDVERSIDAGTVIGVDDGGPAYAAGLRDGQTLKGYSVHFNEPDKQITLTVEHEDTLREISYYPRGASMQVPEYVLD
ncbi:MAG: hypothetical protein GF341_08660 [candidate division Zixibacteria bacterium]|nr:hypothetical protein [candidate division Zixibacteria bacterium]